MGRSEHFLYRPRPSPWPKAVVALATDVTWTQSATDAERQIATLRAWHVIVVAKGKGGYAVARRASGQTPQSFWDGLAECIYHVGNATIICHNTRAAACVLELWERMENGYISPKGRDYREPLRNARDMPDMQQNDGGATGGAAGAMGENPMRHLPGAINENVGDSRRRVRVGHQQRKGVVIVQDPPIVLELSLCYAGLSVKWLDLLNYGVELGDLGDDGAAAVQAVADWFLAASACLKSISDCGWQNTAGSQAMHLYKRSFLNHAILSHTHPKGSALERQALFGGRCECFRVGRIGGASHLLDIRSMYPSICASLPLPVRLCGVLERPDASTILRHSLSHHAIAECEVATDEPRYPYRVGFSTIYPTGRYTTHLAGSELRYAISVGHVAKVRYAALYETDSALRGYAETLYAARQSADLSGNCTQSAFVKRLMVSVVGKFAQMDRAWVDCPNAECSNEWAEWYARDKGGELSRWRSIAGWVQKEVIGGWSHGSVPAVTVAITSEGRHKINTIMDVAGRENVWYCDTDAVIVNDYGMELLDAAGWIRPGEWGYLQRVISADDLVIYGDKYYTIGSRTRTAGVSRRAAGCSIPVGASASHPWFGWSLAHNERPADWRKISPATVRVTRYEKTRDAGGYVKPVTIMEW